MEPVVELVDEGEGVWDVIAFWTEEQQHSQRKILCTTKHNIDHTWSDVQKEALIENLCINCFGAELL